MLDKAFYVWYHGADSMNILRDRGAYPKEYAAPTVAATGLRRCGKGGFAEVCASAAAHMLGCAITSYGLSPAITGGGLSAYYNFYALPGDDYNISTARLRKK